MEVKPELVVAIDIGSTYSGYAWQWRSDFENNRSHVEFNTNWGHGANKHKTSTCILLKAREGCSGDYDIEAFGQAAEHIYKTMSRKNENDILGRWYLFKRFKHYLNQPGFNTDINAEDQRGQHVKLQIVMTKLIQALKDHFIKRLTDKGQLINMKTILWVITVPAIWSDKAKNFMRDAAKKSGIKENNLLLALESEAAALYCIHLPSEQRANMNNLGTPGQVFLTADLGGLTADLYAVEIKKDGSLHGVCSSQGQLVGGQNVNDAFFHVCRDSFGGKTWTEITEKATPVEIMDMEDDFEQQKVQIGTSDHRLEDIELKVPKVVRKEIKMNTIRIKETSDMDSKLKIVDGGITFNSEFIRNVLFKETCLSICVLIKSELERKELRECSMIVLVGGFVESPIVVEHIRGMIQKSFPNINVVVPSSSFQAVVVGSVLYGHNPQMLKTRIMRYTYGVGANDIFNKDIHDIKKRFLNREDKKHYCKDILSVHVKRGESVTLDKQQMMQKYSPMSKTQTSANFLIYASTEVPKKDDRTDSERVMYTTDKGCFPIGEVDVQMPDTTDGSKRSVLVSMIYGGTELSVRAIDETTGRDTRAEIKFSNM